MPNPKVEIAFDLSANGLGDFFTLDDTTIVVGGGTTHSGTHSGLFGKEMGHVLTETGFDVLRLPPLPDSPNATPFAQFIKLEAENFKLPPQPRGSRRSGTSRAGGRTHDGT